MNIVNTLSEQRKGKLLAEASEELARVVKACRDTGKKGKLTITLKIRPTSTEMMLSDEIKSDIPKPDAAASVFYDDDDGQLHRDDPHQEDLPFTALPETAEAK